MTITGFIVVLVMIWWVVLFMVLPIAVKKDDHLQPGNDPGAPGKSYIKVKMLAATIIAFILTSIFFYLLGHGYLDFVALR